MSRTSSGDQRRIAAITEQLGTFRPGEASVVPGLLDDIAALLHSEHVVTYAATPGTAGATLDYAFRTPAASRFEACFRAVSPPARYGFFNPTRPEVEQRNRPFNLERLTRLTRGASSALFDNLPRFGMPTDDQLRVLLCDGPSLLGLVSVLRDRRFDKKEQTLFAKLVPALQRRLKLERDLASATLHRAAMEAALESVSARFTVTRLCSDGEPAAWLAIERCTDTAAARAKARSVLAAQRYSLTKRQREVLELLVQGMANKSIAAALGCVVSTVEIHVTAILERAQVDSRAALVAKFWTES